MKNRIKGLDRTPNLREGKIDYYKGQFKEAIENDLNTSSMLTLVYDVLKDNELTDFTKLYLIEDFDKVLSLDLTVDDETEIEDEQYILDKIEERKQAKSEHDFEKADAIRDELLNQGIRLIDTREGTTYEKI